MKPRRKPGRQIIAAQKNMAGLGQAILDREIGIIKLIRDRNAVFAPAELCLLVCHGNIPYMKPENWRDTGERHGK